MPSESAEVPQPVKSATEEEEESDDNFDLDERDKDQNAILPP